MSQQTARWDANPAPGPPPAGSQARLCGRRAVSSRGVVSRGGHGLGWSSPGGSSLARQIAPLGHSLRRGDPPAVRFPCPYRVSRARPASRSSPCVRGSSLQSLRARPLAGIRSGVVVAWRLIVHLRWNVLGATPTPALRVCFFCLGESGSVKTKAPSEIDPASLRSVTVQAAYEPAECSGWFRSFLTPPCASPHSDPLRPPHTAAPPASASGSDLFRVVLRRSFSVNPSHPLAQLRAAPPCRARSSHRIPAPRAASGRLASSAVLVIPGASAFVPHLCSLVVPAGSLDAAPSGGKSSYRLFR